MARCSFLHTVFPKSSGKNSLDCSPVVGPAIHCQEDAFLSIPALHDDLQFLSKRFRQDRDPVFILLSVYNSDGHGREIQIPDSDAYQLAYPNPRAIQHGDHQAVLRISDPGEKEQDIRSL